MPSYKKQEMYISSFSIPFYASQLSVTVTKYLTQITYEGPWRFKVQEGEWGSPWRGGWQHITAG
jgi:hypothetical protein